MEAMRKSWTDERLDDLSSRDVDAALRHFEGARHPRGALDKLEGRLDKLEGRLDKMLQVLLQIARGGIVAMLGVFAALIGVIASRL